jgi:hypothetical protein
MPGKRMRLSRAVSRPAATSRPILVMPYNTLVLLRSIWPMRCCVFSHVEECASGSAPMYDSPRGVAFVGRLACLLADDEQPARLVANTKIHHR